MIGLITSPFNNIFARTFLFYQLITRLTLASYAVYLNQIELKKVIEIILLGTVNDLVAAIYILPIILIFITIFNVILYQDKFRKIFSFIFYIILNFILMLTLFGEVFFWDEFGNRFNFIAVDYLIYTHEIVNTVRETLPIESILMSMILVSLLIAFFKRQTVFTAVEENSNKLNIILIIILPAFSLLLYKFYEPQKIIRSSNNFVKELAKNGPYQFVYAFLNNQLSYRNYYKNIDSEIANLTIRSLIKQKTDRFTDNSIIERYITNNNSVSNSPKNVVMIVVESLSAEYMSNFGNKENLTPFLDSLSDKSLFFTNLYASGTRTVRGLEALTLSIPPTPGSSIIRRPNNENLFSISTILSKNNYNLDFIYGGYSYFDNMKYFYQNNGFNVIDRRDFLKNEITFSNIWGIADEDVFKKMVQLLDKRHEENKPFFTMMVTTTNHRPYTFPEGTISMPQKSRESVVRYTDYAIEKFFKMSENKDWFNDTIFVIVADHCASSAGKTSLPYEKYHIPLIIYSPKNIKPKKIKTLASQIDITPTLLALMNISYDSKFFGNNLLIPHTKRAFISTYQLLGYMKYDELKKKNYLVVLSPNTNPKIYNIDNKENILVNDRDDLIIEAVSFYQTAYDYFINHTKSKTNSKKIDTIPN